jgi:hypothetical protein
LHGLGCTLQINQSSRLGTIRLQTDQPLLKFFQSLPVTEDLLSRVFGLVFDLLKLQVTEQLADCAFDLLFDLLLSGIFFSLTESRARCGNT